MTENYQQFEVLTFTTIRVNKIDRDLFYVAFKQGNVEELIVYILIF